MSKVLIVASLLLMFTLGVLFSDACRKRAQIQTLKEENITLRSGMDHCHLKLLCILKVNTSPVGTVLIAEVSDFKKCMEENENE